MTKIIPTKFDNTKCRKCNRAIAYGENVRWTKGEKGVTCVTCPGQVVNATTGEPVENETAWESLSRRFNVVQAEANTLRAERNELANEIVRLRGALAVAVEVTQQLGRERDALIADRRVGPLAQLPMDAIEDSGEYEAVAPSSIADENDCPI